MEALDLGRLLLRGHTVAGATDARESRLGVGLGGYGMSASCRVVQRVTNPVCREFNSMPGWG